MFAFDFWNCFQKNNEGFDLDLPIYTRNTRCEVFGNLSVYPFDVGFGLYIKYYLNLIKEQLN